MYVSNLFRAGWVVSGCLAVTLTSGCGYSGNGYELAPVTGVIVYNGKPLERGSLMFTPVDDGPSAQGIIEEGGRFSMTTVGDTGAVIGKHEISIVIPGALDGPMLPENMIKSPKKKVLDLPEHFSDPKRSGLQVEVHAGDNNLKLELSDKEGKVITES